MRSLAILPFLLVPACATGPDANTALADLPGLKLAVQAGAASDTKPTSGFVAFEYDTAAFRAAHNNACAVVAGLSGTIGDTPLDGTNYGGENDLGECTGPAIDFSTMFSGPTTVTVSDGGTPITATFAADAFAPHTPMLESSSSWVFKAGESVRIRWSNAADLVNASTDPYNADVSFGPGTNYGDNGLLLDPQFAGDQIQFTLPPPPLAASGAGFIFFTFGGTDGAATTCSGATSCLFSTQTAYTHSATLTN